jgi:tRNA nucleotidyltransferase (CCA-adding enzyme)
VVQLLKSYDLPLLMLVAVRLDRRRQAIRQYLSHWSQVKPLLDRNDLQQLGYKPGKEFKLILAAVLAATLDGGGASLEVIAAYIKSQGTDD